MGILDIFKKKEEPEKTMSPSPEEIPISQVLQMKERGLTNNQIIQVLQQQGFNPQQIYDALAQAEARQSIEPHSPAQDMPREPLSSEAPLMQNQVNQGYPQQQYQHQTHTPEELVESIIHEKWQKMTKEITKITEWKDGMTTKMERMEQQIIDLKSTMENLHKAIVSRVGEYDKTLSEVGTEIKAMEKVFKDVLPEMTNNIQELSRLTHELKGEKTISEKPLVKKKVVSKNRKDEGTELERLTKRN